MAELDPKLRDDLERFGRMCALAQIQLREGAPGMAVLGGAEGMRKLLDAIIPALAANTRVWVQVNPDLGPATAEAIADVLGSEVPDFPPEDLR